MGLGVRFCTSCGGSIAADTTDGVATENGPGAEPPAERRRISVLFVDLENFTALAESLDPEELRIVQSRYFEVARSVVARYGGTIEKFIGDAVMAVWGAPLAHEDDAERAVRAALEIVDAVGRLGGAA
ncbi:MAG TPA: adenylate/guanylate cyclase domain-containing protein, partial [Candidatus Limnocylindrales bacterium]|nr:adenylate/guanylate cyclase domain-containing protein [Candidatus Limnocylindrales bacterium]